MRRREFISLIGCGAATWPLAAHAQQTDRMRRLGMLMVGDENDALRGAKGWFARFTQGLAELGWTDGRNLRMDVRWVGDSVDRARIYAKELVDQLFGLAAPDVERNTCGSASRHFFPSLFAAPRTGCLQYKLFSDAENFFLKKNFTLTLNPAAVVATHAAVACDDAMTWDGWVVIGSHDSADGAGCLRIAGPGRDFFVCHRLPFRDLPHDVANFVGEAFHIPSVALSFDFVTGFFTLACNSLPAASRYPQYSQVGLAAGIVSPRRQSFILKISGSIQSVSPLCGMTFTSNSSLQSILRQRERLASQCRRPCWLAPTR